MAFTPAFPIPAVLGFLLACLVALGAGAAVGLAVLLRRVELARKILLGAIAAGALYVVVLVGVSLASDARELGPGEWKYFCEVDCHLAYTVTGVERVKTLGGATAAGEFWVVTLTVWFDENTISSQRPKDMPLAPPARKARVVDASGRQYPVSAAGQQALEAARANVPLCRPLRPGESHPTELVFDLPEGVRAPRLLLTTADLPVNFIIGHESSLLHKKISFRLVTD